MSEELAELQKKFTDLHAISMQMANALRLAVMTEFPEERSSALAAWDRHVSEVLSELEARLRQRI